MHEVEDIGKFLYAQSSRYININHSFIREAIEDDSIVIAVPKRGGREIPLARLEEREIEILESRMKLTKKTSLHLINSEIESYDFKKKCKFNVYRSMILPGSKELVWREDNCSEVPRKVLARRLTKFRSKKIDQIDEMGEEEDNDELQDQRLSLSSTRNNNIGDSLAKDMLEEEKKKEKCLLFHSENLKRRCDVKRLKPPKIGKDIFEEMEDIEDKEEGKVSASRTKEGEATAALYRSSTTSLRPKLGFPDESSQAMEI
jgi:hypothetical protein